MRLTLDLHPELIAPDLAAETKDEVLVELIDIIANSSSGLERSELLRTLHERERLGSTGIGDGIAIPHGKLRGIDRVIVAFGRSLKGVDFNSLDGRKVHLFFLLLAPDDATGMHLRTLARISRILKDQTIRKELLDAPDAAAIHSIIRGEDSRH